MRGQPIHDERGWVLVTALMVLTTMLVIALTSFTIVDRGQQHSHDQRQRESALNLAEGALYSQGFALAQKWPGNALAGANVPTSCTEVPAAAAVASYCPTPSTLAAAQGSPATANFANSDSLSDVTWTTRIRDNGGPSLAGSYVSGAAAEATQSGTNVATGLAYTCPGPCRWDANGDRQLWVQARAVVQGKARNIVALLKREQFTEPFPRNTVTAGSFAITNSGNKTVVDATTSQVAVRCTALTAACADYDAGKGQVQPAAIIRDAALPPALTARQIARFKAAAQTADPPTYFTSCQPSLEGRIIFLDIPATTSCSDSSGAVYNTPEAPGMVIIPRGRFTLAGTLYGLIYAGNEQNSSGPVLTLNANSYVFGGVAVDGPGRLVIGQASGPRPTISFMASAFNLPVTFGTTGLVQNTWRELPAN
jgi:Tfp pilus assembly protein PilX